MYPLHISSHPPTPSPSRRPEKNCSDSFPFVFIQILVLHGTENFKEPHQQSVYIEKKGQQTWTSVDYDKCQVLGGRNF